MGSKWSIGPLMAARNRPIQFFRSLTLNQPASDLSNFPVLISGTYSYLASTANGGKVKNPNGYDIRFFSDRALTSLLKFERVLWTAADGTIEFWVKIPTLTSATATVIYMAYGNNSITTDQQDAANTWDTAYQGVWHLPDGTTLTANDSKGVNNGTLVGPPTATSGKIDGGANLASVSNQNITFGNVIDFTTNDFTIEFWYNTSTTSGYIINKIASNSGYYLAYLNAGTGKITLYVQTDDANWAQKISTNNTADGQWHHFVGVRTGGGHTLTIYIDGSVDSGTTQGAGNATTVTNSGSLQFTNSVAYYNGKLDEVRISNSARLADWVSAEYSNQNNPSGFYVLGGENSV